MASTALMLPATCGELPLKSTVTSALPLAGGENVSATAIRTGPEPAPSSSRKSSFITSMRDPAQESAHELLRIILQLLHYLPHTRDSITRGNFLQAFCACVTGCDLCVEVAPALLRRAYIVQQKPQNIFLNFSPADQLD